MRYALRPSWPPLLPFRQPHAQTAAALGRPAGPTRAVDPKVPQPGQQDKIFPLSSSWVAVSLNGKPFGGERPTSRSTTSFAPRGFGGCNNYSATAYPLREQGMAVGPFALTKKACDKGAMASEQAFLVALRTAANGTSTARTLIIKTQNGELRSNARFDGTSPPALIQTGRSGSPLRPFHCQRVYFATAGSRFSTGENKPSAPFCMPTLRSWKAARVERWPIDTMVVFGSSSSA